MIAPCHTYHAASAVSTWRYLVPTIHCPCSPEQRLVDTGYRQAERPEPGQVARAGNSGKTSQCRLLVERMARVKETMPQGLTAHEDIS